MFLFNNTQLLGSEWTFSFSIMEANQLRIVWGLIVLFWIAETVYKGCSVNTFSSCQPNAQGIAQKFLVRMLLSLR